MYMCVHTHTHCSFIVSSSFHDPISHFFYGIFLGCTSFKGFQDSSSHPLPRHLITGIFRMSWERERRGIRNWSNLNGLFWNPRQPTEKAPSGLGHLASLACSESYQLTPLNVSFVANATHLG